MRKCLKVSGGGIRMQKLKEKWLCLGYIGGYAKKYIISNGLLQLLDAGIAYLYIEMLNYLYQQITAHTFGMKVWFVFLAVSGCILLSDFMNGITNMSFEKMQNAIEKGFMEFYLQSVGKLEPEQCLRKDVLDAQQNMKYALEGVIFYYAQLGSLLFRHIPYYILVLIFLARIDIRIAAVMLITFLPAVITWKIRRNVNYNVTTQIGEKKRSMEAFESYNTTLPALYETRFFHMQNRFKELFNKNMRDYCHIQTKYYRNMFGVTLLADFLHLLGIGIILGFIVFMVRQHEMNGAQVATVLTVLLSIYDSMSSVMNECVGTIYENAGKIQVIMEFTRLTNQIERFTNILLKNVSYHYPDAEKLVLKDINLELKDSEVLAIVGENGSGKTTLSKVLGGMLPEKGGQLLVNGNLIEEKQKSAYRSHVSAVFQDFQHYPLTLKENILFGEKVDDGVLEDLLKKVQLENKNTDVVLSKEFGGEEYSGGQWQRVAIARGAFKKSDLLIFDEPTSAIDPLEEVRIMKLLLSLCKDRMAVLVTHRIGAASLADRIAVMKEGKLVEIGRHDELLAKQGEYYRMDEMQKQWYL